MAEDDDIVMVPVRREVLDGLGARSPGDRSADQRLVETALEGWSRRFELGPHEVLVFRPEIGAESPIWTTSGVTVSPDSVGIGPELAADLADWARRAVEEESPPLTIEGLQLFVESAAAVEGGHSLCWDASNSMVGIEHLPVSTQTNARRRDEIRREMEALHSELGPAPAGIVFTINEYLPLLQDLAERWFAGPLFFGVDDDLARRLSGWHERVRVQLDEPDPEITLEGMKLFVELSLALPNTALYWDAGNGFPGFVDWPDDD